MLCGAIWLVILVGAVYILWWKPKQDFKSIRTVQTIFDGGDFDGNLRFVYLLQDLSPEQVQQTVDLFIKPLLRDMELVRTEFEYRDDPSTFVLGNFYFSPYDSDEEFWTGLAGKLRKDQKIYFPIDGIIQRLMRVRCAIEEGNEVLDSNLMPCYERNLLYLAELHGVDQPIMLFGNAYTIGEAIEVARRAPVQAGNSE